MTLFLTRTIITKTLRPRLVTSTTITTVSTVFMITMKVATNLTLLQNILMNAHLMTVAFLKTAMQIIGTTMTWHTCLTLQTI